MLTCIGLDDEAFNHDYLKHCCSNIPFVKIIGTFTDPFAALPLLSSGQIDLVFLDFDLGQINAPEFVTKIPQSVQVIIISAEFERKIREYGMKLTAILPKPYPCECLLQACKIGAKLKFQK